MTNFKLCLGVKHSHFYKYTGCTWPYCCHTCQNMLLFFLIQAWLECVRLLRVVQVNVLCFDVFGGQMLPERTQLAKGKEKREQLWGWKSPKRHPPHQTQCVLATFLILQLLRWPSLIPSAILMGCKTLGTCALPSSSLTLLCDLCPNKLIYVFSQWVPTTGFLLSSIPAHNNSVESQTLDQICTKFSKFPKQLKWGNLTGQFFI